MTNDTLAKLAACPFCGKSHTLKISLASEVFGVEDEPYMHSEAYAVTCDASRPDGPGGCGASGGYRPTEAEAIEAWEARALTAQALPAAPEPLWCISIPGPDEHHAAPSVEAEVHMKQRHNAAMKEHFERHPDPEGMGPLRESCMAEVRLWPWPGQEHAKALESFDAKAWGWPTPQAAQQAAQAPCGKCDECGKGQPEGWALYCVSCLEKTGLLAKEALPNAQHVSSTAADLTGPNYTAAQAPAGRTFSQVYRCKIKSRRQIMKEIPREHQGWWADVSAGQVLNLRQAVQADLDRCNLSAPRSRNPDDYMCETFERGALVSKVALEYMNPEQHVFALAPVALHQPPQPQEDAA